MSEGLTWLLVLGAIYLVVCWIFLPVAVSRISGRLGEISRQLSEIIRIIERRNGDNR